VHLREDLEKGYAILTPKEQPAGFDRVAWWRVNPDTGETLGILDDGRGVEITEYQVTAFFGIAGLGFLHYSLYGCFSQAYGSTGSAANYQLLCCVLVNYGSMMVMTILSALIGVAVGLTSIGEFAANAIPDAVGFGVDLLDLGLGFDGLICNLILN
jgi:hypothetical protein